MLVLTRRQDEQIVIGGDIVVTVVEVKGNMVRLGFDAPPQVSIHRREVHEEIARANRLAASVSPEDVERLRS
jgi:carbon storage regulator